MLMDVYLAGYADTKWREEFKNTIARDIEISDPFDSKYNEFTSSEKANQIAKELENIENCQVVVFYFCPEWDSCYSILQLGDAVGRGKQVTVCLIPGSGTEEKIRRYCEYRGVLIVSNLEDLVVNTEEYLAQLDILEVANEKKLAKAKR